MEGNPMSNHILIIEDDAAIAQVLRLNLECADYTVTPLITALPRGTRWKQATITIWRCWT